MFTGEELNVLLGIVLGLGILSGLIHKGDYEKHQHRIGLAIFYGVVSAFASLFFSSITLDALSLTTNQGAVFVGPIVEEAFKGFFAIMVINKIKKPKNIDGFVLGGFVGLGFAVIEDLIYVLFSNFTYTTTIELGIYRGIMTIVTHVLFTGVFGYYYLVDKKEWGRGYIIAVGIHMAWNYLIVRGSLIVLGMIILFGFIYYYYRKLAETGKRVKII